MQSTKTLALSAIFAAALAACGGGGGDATPTATTPTATTPPAPTAQSTIVTSVPAATYAAGSDERAAYDLLNAERQKCGFGLLAQDTRLDAAAAAHVNYLLKNNVFSHAETAGLPGFTGVNPITRTAAQGYLGSAVGEDGGGVESGLANMRVLLVAPYHLSSLVSNYVDVGLSFQKTTVAQQFSSALFIDLGVKTTNNPGQLPATGTVLNYPCDGAVDVKPSFAGESPNWAATTGIGAGGTPIVLTAPNGETLAITNASITPVGGGIVPVQVLTAANDPNKFLKINKALIIPPSSLVANSSYRVQITGTVAGAAFSKDFTFKTGS